MEKKKLDVFQRKSKARTVNEQANIAAEEQKFHDAEKLYSEAIELNKGSRELWTNRAACRYMLEKYDDAISDCNTALSIDRKCSRTIIEKGNSLLKLQKFKEAEACYNSLRSLGEAVKAETHLKKLHKIQDRILKKSDS